MPQIHLDIEDPLQLRDYLVHRLFITPDEPIDMTVLGGGVSNRTVHLRYRAGECVLKQALPKLRVKVDWFSDPRRIHQEALGLTTLSSLVPGASPQLIFEDLTHDLLAMRAVPQPHANWKTMLLQDGPTLDHIQQFADLLAAIHRRSFDQRDALQSTFADRSFFESLRIEPYYQYTAAGVPRAARFFDDLIQATRATSLALVHGDYSPKNVLVHHGKMVLLDHEVIHWGDPAFDVGFSMTHLLSKAHHCTSRRDAFLDAAKAYWDRYHASLGDVPWAAHVQHAGVRHALACLLARCRGRSPLEYLDEDERTHQAALVVQLIDRPPMTMRELIEQFSERL